MARRLLLHLLIAGFLSGCGILERGPSAPSGGLIVPAAAVVSDGRGGSLQLNLGSVVGSNGTYGGYASRGFSGGGWIGGRHDGIDLPAPSGAPIHAAADGDIAEIGWRGAYGRFVLIRHAGTVETAYAHLSRFAGGLVAGSRVRRGDVIGYVGATGNATGPHLHYEVRRDGRAVDPMERPAGLFGFRF